MSEKNLAICFAPCWMRSQSQSLEDIVLNTGKAANYSQLLISQFNKIFGEKEAREEIYR